MGEDRERWLRSARKILSVYPETLGAFDALRSENETLKAEIARTQVAHAERRKERDAARAEVEKLKADLKEVNERNDLICGDITDLRLDLLAAARAEAVQMSELREIDLQAHADSVRLYERDLAQAKGEIERLKTRLSRAGVEPQESPATPSEPETADQVERFLKPSEPGGEKCERCGGERTVKEWDSKMWVESPCPSCATLAAEKQGEGL